MKKCALHLLSLLLATNQVWGMLSAPAYYQPTSRTQTHVERALEAFEIPAGQVKIYGFSAAPHSLVGCSNSDKNEIGILEPNPDDNWLTYISFHEAAHLKESSNIKIRAQITALPDAVRNSMMRLCQPYNQAFVLSNYPNNQQLAQIQCCLANASWLKWFREKCAFAWAAEQAEYRADKMATEKLIQLNQLGPILAQLAHKKMLQKTLNNQKVHGHPAPSDEYLKIEEILKKHGFEVINSRSLENPHDLTISISKDGENTQITLKNYY